MGSPATGPREEYVDEELRLADLAASPFDQFGAWLADAIAARIVEPNAMTLATASADGAPSARMVLLKHFDADGFVFCSSQNSSKGRDLAANARAALVFWWGPLVRQVRIEGTVHVLGASDSDAYHRARPNGAQLAAWAAQQSAVVADRAAILDGFAAARTRFGNDVPRPPWWVAYRVEPATIEFWLGRAHRLSDRFRYARDAAGWHIERLAP